MNQIILELLHSTRKQILEALHRWFSWKRNNDFHELLLSMSDIDCHPSIRVQKNFVSFIFFYFYFLTNTSRCKQTLWMRLTISKLLSRYNIELK